MYDSGSCHSWIPDLGTTGRTTSSYLGKMGSKQSVQVLVALTGPIPMAIHSSRRLSVCFLPLPSIAVLIRCPVDVMEPALWLPFPDSVYFLSVFQHSEKNVACLRFCPGQWHEAHLEREREGWVTRLAGWPEKWSYLLLAFLIIALDISLVPLFWGVWNVWQLRAH